MSVTCTHYNAAMKNVERRKDSECFYEEIRGRKNIVEGPNLFRLADTSKGEVCDRRGSRTKMRQEFFLIF